MNEIEKRFVQSFSRMQRELQSRINIRINSATKFPKFFGKREIISDVSKYDTNFRIPRIGWFRISFGQLPS